MKNQRRNYNRRGRRAALPQPAPVEVEEQAPVLGICAECYEERLVRRCEKCNLNYCEECREGHECC